ncbi:MAG: DNA/RNA helicase [Salinivirgaceae bacterium]|nr:DNA/RNA helicase [Salinivirgaceae bacterium]
MEDEFYIDYAKLDDIQRGFVNRKLNKSMVVTGTAGSGKSLIALHKAKQVANITDSYCVVVYTKTLRRYFEDGLKNLELKNVYHYHRWKDEKPSAKYIIVDECQDFSADEINELINSAEIGFFFGDTDQSIVEFRTQTQDVDTTAHALGLPRAEPLYTNYRLTIENAEFAEIVGDVQDVAEKCIRHGGKPELIKTDTIEAQLDEIIRLKRNNSLSNVGILMPFNTIKSANSAKANGHILVENPEKLSVEYVKDYFISKGEPVEYKYSADKDTAMDLDFHSTNAKVMTWWCAKGLQFKDVFIPNCQVNYGTNKKKALYVAVTRVVENLHLLYSGQISPQFPKSNSSLYKSNDIDISDLF